MVQLQTLGTQHASCVGVGTAQNETKYGATRLSFVVGEHVMMPTTPVFNDFLEISFGT